jgi:CybS, succinate dehydrogenase cytochrome B small subunit
VPVHRILVWCGQDELRAAAQPYSHEPGRQRLGATMSSSLILRSTVPRTFRAVSGRSALLKAVQGLSKVNNTFLISQPTNEQRDMLQPLQPTCPAAVSDQSFSLTTPKPSISYIAVYKGTVNDPTDFPPPSKSHGSYHWAFERLLSAGLVPLTAAAFVKSGRE